MPLLPTNFGALYYELSGPAEAPVLVLSNSLGTDHTMWAAQVPALAGHLQVLRYDTRGHGQSAVPPGPYAVADLGRDVLALLDGLGIAQASFCGLSLGGLTGQWLGINAPKRLLKLVLSNTAARIGTPEGWHARIGQVGREGLGPLAEATAGRWFTPAFRQREPAAVARVLATFRATDPAGYMAACAAVRDAAFQTGLPHLAVPTLVLASTDDPVTTIADGQALAGSIPRAELLLLPGAHLANVESAAAYTAALLHFLLN